MFREQDRLTLTVEETARLLGISRGVAYDCIRQGVIPSIKFNRVIRVPKHALDMLLGNGSVEGAQED